LALNKRALATLLGGASGLFKGKLTRAFLESGEELKSDDDLRALQPNDKLYLTYGAEFQRRE